MRESDYFGAAKKMELSIIQQVIRDFPTPIVALCEQGTIRIWNKKCEEVLGYSEEEMLNRRVGLEHLMANRRRFSHALRRWRSRTGDEEFFESYPMRHCNGSEVPINWTIRYRPQVVFPELPIWGIGFHQDNFNAINRRLAESEEKFNLIARATNDALWDFNLATGHLWFNDGMYSQFGYGTEDRNPDLVWWENLLHPDDRDRVVKSFSEMLESGSDFWSCEYRFQRADGEYAYVSDRGFTLRDHSGVPTRIIGGMVDITLRVKYERELERKNQQLSDIAFFNSHKLRSPLARIMGLAQAMQLDKENATPEQHALAEKMLQTSQELDEMVREMALLSNPG